MLPITELAGRYHLEELIAIGGMGEVWQAMDQALSRSVAVKLLRPEYLHDEVTLLRFRAEAQHAGLLNHPGIAQVYDYQDASLERPAYLVMELVTGPSLAGLLTGGRLDPRRTADVLAQAAAALHAAHAAGVLHRDIKPGNLLLASDGQVKVTDFGIAQSSRTGHLTRTGALLGTTGYLAPERVSGRSATVASDLYALGIVGYECLTGRPPFQGEPLQVALAHRDQDLPALPPCCLSEPGGTELAALITDLTARDPADRPVSAAVVAERAGRIRDGRAPVPRSTEPDLLPPAGPRRRRLGPAGLAAGLVTAGLLGWLLATAQAGPGHPVQARSGQSGSVLTSPHQAARPAPVRTGASTPAPSSSPGPTAPVPKTTSTVGGGTHVPPGRAKHGKGPPPGHD
jgi:serine/threonine-protein kinase